MSEVSAVYRPAIHMVLWMNSELHSGVVLGSAMGQIAALQRTKAFCVTLSSLSSNSTRVPPRLALVS
jgi:hypothetical protein